MKRILFLLLAQIATLAYAQDSRYSMLKLRLSDTSAIAVRLDGVFIDRHTHSLTLDGIRPGNHQLIVYSIDEIHRKLVRIYTGTVVLHGGNVNVGVVDVYHRSLGMRIRTMNAADRGPADRHYQEQPTGKGNQHDDIYGRPPENHGTSGKAPETVQSSSPEERKTDPNASGTEGLSASTMDDLHIRVRTLLTDTEREALLKKDLDSQRFSSAELREMLSWLAFESTRLSIAQWSYSRITDQDQFPKLEDVFENDEDRKDFRKIFSGPR